MKTIKKNTQVTIKHILGETAEVLVTRLDNGKYQFNCDAYVVGEYCKGGFSIFGKLEKLFWAKSLETMLSSGLAFGEHCMRQDWSRSIFPEEIIRFTIAMKL